MAKGKKNKKQKTTVEKKETTPSFKIENKVLDILFPLLMALFLLILLKPLVIDGLSYQGVDTLASMAKTHQLSEYYQKTGERALWNPYIFCGMPIYHRYGPVSFSADTLLEKLGRLSHVVFIYYLLGALGFYVLARYLKFHPLLALVGSLLFILMPHYKSLYLVGHLAKFKALMYLPWIFLSFRYFLDKRSLAAIALFALAFGLQIRTQHYQIVFYSAVMVFALGVYPLIKDILEKQYVRFARSVVLIMLGVVLGVGMAAQPLFLAKEYLPYSKRGKTTVNVEQKTAGRARSDGVSMEYATRWSTHPSELFTWLVPRFYGGMSQEKYDGSRYPQYRGQELPTYWGHMPFTQSYEYMGVLTLFLALVGWWFNRRKSWAISLAVFAVWLVLLSFGRHWQGFYALFYNYVPYFNKFRAPMMSVTVTYFVVVVFALYGMRVLQEMAREGHWFKDHRPVWVILGAFALLGLVLWIYGWGASFVKPGGERLQGQVLELIKSIRAEMFTADLLRSALLVVIGAAAVALFLTKKINGTVLVLLLGVIAVSDLLQIQQRSQRRLTNIKRIERQYFKKTATDAFLQKDQEIYRVFPTGQLFGDNRWAYYHQTIGGYTPIKMYAIEELVEKNVYNGPDKRLPINWNVLKITNVKYLIAQGRVDHPALQLVHVDQQNRWLTYYFKKRLPRAYFVGQVKVIPDEIQRLKTINSAEFDPAREAIVEEALNVKIEQPDSAFARMQTFTPNYSAYEAYSDKPALLVFSEVSYPPGWHVFIDGKEVSRVYRANHAMMAVPVTAGKHKIELKFSPASYYRMITVSWIALGVIYLVLLIWGGTRLWKTKQA